MILVCACDEGNPALHSPGEWKDTKMKHFGWGCGVSLCGHVGAE